MPEHRATIRWSCNEGDFLKGRYSREHTWTFDGGVTVPASPSPHVVPAPWSNPANVDPEEAVVAAVSSCHMLTFLWLASKAGFQVNDYTDEAVGVLAKDQRGIPWLSQITLNVRIGYGGERSPAATEEQRLHHEAHQQCFIANSIKSEVQVRCLHRETPAGLSGR